MAAADEVEASAERVAADDEGPAWAAVTSMAGGAAVLRRFR